MADGGSIKVKLILDTTQYDEALARVKASLAELAAVRIGVNVVDDRKITEAEPTWVSTSNGGFYMDAGHFKS